MESADASRVRKGTIVLVAVAALSVTAGAVGVGFGLGHQQAQETTTTLASKPQPSSTAVAASAPASPTSSSTPAKPVLDLVGATGIIKDDSGTPYLAGRDHADATYDEDPGDVATEEVCGDAGTDYLTTQYAQYEVTSDARSALLSEFVAGCVDVYDERWEAAEDARVDAEAAASSNVDEYGYIAGAGGPMPSTIAKWFTPEKADAFATKACNALYSGSYQGAAALNWVLQQQGVTPDAAFDATAWIIDTHCPDIGYSIG